MPLFFDRCFLSQLLSGMLLLSLTVSCAPTAAVKGNQSFEEKQAARSPAPSAESYDTPPAEDNDEYASKVAGTYSEPEGTKKCATWQDLVFYRENNPSFLADIPFPQPPQRFQDGCIQVDAAPGGFNVYITENSFDDGQVKPLEPEVDLILGFIPPGGIRRSEDSNSLAPGEPEWMHIGFSSSLNIEENEDFYQVTQNDDYAQYQRVFTNASPVPIEERVAMLEATKSEWESSH